jgi:hypothetical protein
MVKYLRLINLPKYLGEMNMEIEKLKAYCLSKLHSKEDYPFGLSLLI